jgi:surface antigen
MRATTTLVAALMSGTIALGGCANEPTQRDVGMVIGGIIGGVLGSQVGRGHGATAATIAGAIVGAAIGGAIGRSMDEADKTKMGATLETVRTGVPTTWRNPDTDSTYTVVPTRTYDSASGPCREYTVDAVIGGNTEKAYGTACRQPDGSWRIQN